MEIKLNTAYFVAKEELLFSKFEGLLSLQRKNELSINFTYANKKSCAESYDEGRIVSRGIQMEGSLDGKVKRSGTGLSFS